MNRSAASQHSGTVIRIMVVGDLDLVGKALCSFINEEIDLTVVAVAVDGESALAMARLSQPDVILMDTCIPKLNGIQVTRNIRAEMPWIPVIALLLNDEPAARLALRAAGTTTFVARDNILSTLCATIRAIADQAAERSPLRSYRQMTSEQ